MISVCCGVVARFTPANKPRALEMREPTSVIRSVDVAISMGRSHACGGKIAGV